MGRAPRPVSFAAVALNERLVGGCMRFVHVLQGEPVNYKTERSSQSCCRLLSPRHAHGESAR